MSDSDRNIRFITSDYKELFTIPDGGYINITRNDGEIITRQCSFVDECHVRVGSETFHIAQLADRMERAGNDCEPCPEPEIVHGYVIINRMPVGDKVYVMAHNPNAVQPFVTWQGYKEKSNGYDYGHYWSNRSDALSDYAKRAESERTGVPYDHTELIRQRQGRGNGR
jgi:hypothetical protein